MLINKTSIRQIVIECLLYARHHSWPSEQVFAQIGSSILHPILTQYYSVSLSRIRQSFQRTLSAEDRLPDFVAMSKSWCLHFCLCWSKLCIPMVYSRLALQGLLLKTTASHHPTISVRPTPEAVYYTSLIILADYLDVCFCDSKYSMFWVTTWFFSVLVIISWHPTLSSLCLHPQPLSPSPVSQKNYVVINV